MAGRYDPNPFDQGDDDDDQVNPFAVTLFFFFQLSCITFIY